MSPGLAPATGMRESRHRIALAVLVVAGLAALLLANMHLVFVAVGSEPGCVAHVQMRASTTGTSGFAAAQSACSPSDGKADREGEGRRP
jgi:hypothetical protein